MEYYTKHKIFSKIDIFPFFSFLENCLAKPHEIGKRDKIQITFYK